MARGVGRSCSQMRTVAVIWRMPCVRQPRLELLRPMVGRPVAAEHAEAVAANFVHVQLGRHVVGDERLVKQQAVLHRHGPVVAGVHEKRRRRLVGHAAVGRPLLDQLLRRRRRRADSAASRRGRRPRPSRSPGTRAPRTSGRLLRRSMGSAALGVARRRTSWRRSRRQMAARGEAQECRRVPDRRPTRRLGCAPCESRAGRPQRHRLLVLAAAAAVTQHDARDAAALHPPGHLQAFLFHRQA